MDRLFLSNTGEWVDVDTAIAEARYDHEGSTDELFGMMEEIDGMIEAIRLRMLDNDNPATYVSLVFQAMQLLQNRLTEVWGD